MPYEDEDRDKRALDKRVDPSTLPPAYVAPMRASTGAAGGGTGFISAQRYLDLNRGAGQQMAEGVARGIEAGSAADPYGEAAAARARLAGGPGVGTLLGEQYGRFGPYSSGMQGFDAFLAGAAGGDRLGEVARTFGAPKTRPVHTEGPGVAAPAPAPAPAPEPAPPPDPWAGMRAGPAARRKRIEAGPGKTLGKAYTNPMAPERQRNTGGVAQPGGGGSFGLDWWRDLLGG